jgi:hypothetical protein
MAAPSNETGWDRLAAVWTAATARVEPGDPVSVLVQWPASLVGWGRGRACAALSNGENLAFLVPSLTYPHTRSSIKTNKTQVPPAPPEVAEWGANTMMVASAGAIFSGLRGWRTAQAVGEWGVMIFFVGVYGTRGRLPLPHPS